MTIQTNACDQPSTFLADSQADISTIKTSAITGNFTYNPNERVSVKGVTNEIISSLGTIYLSLIIDDCYLEHKYHLFDDRLKIPSDGIIGKEFLRTHKCKIDYGSMTCTIQTSTCELIVNIQSESQAGDIYVLPRAEIFKLFHIKGTSYPVVIESREIGPQILIPTTVAYQPQTWIRVLNVSENGFAVNAKDISLTRL